MCCSHKQSQPLENPPAGSAPLSPGTNN
jgi:hypothetical protein